MRHLILLFSIGVLFSHCASDQTSDTSVYDKHPEIAQKSAETVSSESEDQRALEESKVIEEQLLLEQEAKEAEAKKEEAERAKKEAAKVAAKKAAESAKKTTQTTQKETTKKTSYTSPPPPKTDTRIRPTPREEKISTSIVSNPKTASSTPRQAAPKPIFRWQKKVHDFGWVNEGEKVKFSYQFQNVGNEPLIILEANADCGCTVPSYSKKPVPPGGTGSLDVIFDTKSKAGRQDKKITILANTVPNYTDLRIQGMVDNRPKKDEESKGTTTASKGSTSKPSSDTKSGGSLLDKLKNKVEKDGE